MLNEQFYSNLTEKIKPYFIEGGSHAFDHTERVLKMALNLSRNYEVDKDILKPAVLMHDVARLKEHNKETKCHAKEGAIMASQILSEMNFPTEKIEPVCYAIKVHRHSKGILAETIEAKLLQDADRLDALGAITIARMFSTGGELNQPLYNPKIPFGKEHSNFYTSTIHGFYTKIFRITPESFNTPEAQEIAKERFQYTKQFVERFLKEWNCEL